MSDHFQGDRERDAPGETSEATADSPVAGPSAAPSAGTVPSATESVVADSRARPLPSLPERRRRVQFITTSARLEERQRQWLKDVADARERDMLDARDCDASAVLRELIDRAIADGYR